MPPDVAHLPHPLATLRLRAENEKSPRGRHDASYLLWEAGLRMLAAVLLAEYQRRPHSCPNMTQPLSGLRGPSTGHWRAIVRELLPLLSQRDDDTQLSEVAYLLDTKRTLHDMPAAATLAHAIEKKLRPEKDSQPRTTVRLAGLFDDIVTYRHEVRAHGGLGEDHFFEYISKLMLEGLDEIFSNVDVLCGRTLFRSEHPDAPPMIGLAVPDWSGSRPNEFTELQIQHNGESIPISPWIYWNERQGEVAFFNGFGGGHQKQSLYLTYVSGAKTRRGSHEAVKLIGRLREHASSTSIQPWDPGYDELDAEAEEDSIDRIGDFEILEVIGEGGMGKVYRAYQPSLQRIVALKVMRDPHDAVAVQRFDREIQSLAKVDHPNLVKIYDSGVSGDDYFYTMEFVEGADLSSSIQTNSQNGSTKSSVEEIRRIAKLMIQVSNATEVLNQKGVIHRDIKPANIMVNYAGDRAVLLDLGLAHQIDNQGDLTRTQQFVGTLRYSSPEQATGKSVDTRSDVYSLGATLWELLTQRKMLDNLDSSSPLDLMKAICEGSIRSPSHVQGNVSSELSAITLKCLEKNPDDRYQSAQELADDLDRWIHDQPIRAWQTPRRYRIAKFLKRSKRFLATSTIGLIILLAVGSYLASQWDSRERANRRVQVENQLRSIGSLLDSPTNEISSTVRRLAPLSALQNEMLEDTFANDRETFERRLHSALAIMATRENSHFDQAYIDFLADSLLSAEPDQFATLLQEARPHRERLVERIRSSPAPLFDVFGQTAAERQAMNRFVSSVALTNANEQSHARLPATDRILNLIVNQLLTRAASPASKKMVFDSVAQHYPELKSRVRLAFHHPDRIIRERAAQIIAITSSVPAFTDALLQAGSPDHAMLLWTQAEKAVDGKLSPMADFQWKRDSSTTPLQQFDDASLPKNRLERAAQFDTAFRSVVINLVQQACRNQSETDNFVSLDQALEQKHGWFATSSHAFSIAAPTRNWLQTAERLRLAGYRPVKLRPYTHDGVTKVASVFVRDGQPWFCLFGLTAQEMGTVDRACKGHRYAPVDVAGFLVVDSDRATKTLYSALWAEESNSGVSAGREMFVGLDFDEWGTELSVEDSKSTLVHSINMVPDIDSVSPYGTIAHFRYSGISSSNEEGEYLAAAANRIPIKSLPTSDFNKIFDFSNAVWPASTSNGQQAYWRSAVETWPNSGMRAEAFLQLAQYNKALRCLRAIDQADLTDDQKRDIGLLEIRALIGANRQQDVQRPVELPEFESDVGKGLSYMAGFYLPATLRLLSLEHEDGDSDSEASASRVLVESNDENKNPFADSLALKETAQKRLEESLVNSIETIVAFLSSPELPKHFNLQRDRFQLSKALAAAPCNSLTAKMKCHAMALKLLHLAKNESGDDPRSVEMDHDFDSLRRMPEFDEIIQNMRGPYRIRLEGSEPVQGNKRIEQIEAQSSIEDQLASAAQMPQTVIAKAISVAPLTDSLEIVIGWGPIDTDANHKDMLEAKLARTILTLYAMTKDSKVFSLAKDDVALHLRSRSRDFRRWEKLSEPKEEPAQIAPQMQN